MNIRWFDRESLDSIIKEEIENVDIVLDIGCGIRPQTFIKPRLQILCDPFSEYIQILQNRFVNQSGYLFLTGSWEEVVRMLPDRCVDSVFLLDVIEYLKKEEGILLIRECERVARRQIVLFTPLGFMPQEDENNSYDGWGLQGAKWQIHRSAWTPEDFEAPWRILGSKTYHHVNTRGEKLPLPQGAFYAVKNLKQNPMVSLPVKLAILSHILPPSPSGQSMMLYRLFKEVSPESYCLVSRENYDPFLTLQNSTNRLSAKYFQLPPEKRIPWPSWERVRKYGHGINLVLQLIQRTLYLRRILKQEKCDAILTCSGDLIDIPAGYFASRLSRIPFYAYLFDDYTYQWPHPFYRSFARRVEAKVLRDAVHVVVPNEFLQNELQRRHGIKCQLVHNACEVNIIHERNIPWPYREGEVSIIYTGAVYHAHYDAFRNLITAITRLGRQDVKLHIYTAQKPAELESQNICGFVVYHPHISSNHVMEVQQQADILFLPLAFDSPIAEVIKTSAPGKMGEYLSSGRPILVHAPPDTYLSWYFKQYDCGVVVDHNDPPALQSAIERIIHDRTLRERICRNALLCARTDFDIETARAQFIKLFHHGGRR